MNKKAKTTLIILTVLAIAALLLRTQLARRILRGEDFQITENPAVTFQITENPVVIFNNALAAGSPVFIMFYSALCPPCVLMEPVIVALQQDYSSKMTFIIADVRTYEGRNLARKFGVRSVPHYTLITSNGKTFFSAAGRRSEDFLRGKIKETKAKR